MFLIMFGAMAIMEFVPKIPKPKWVKDAPMPLKIAKGIGIALLELPSSLLSIIFACVMEFFVIRPLGYRTDTIGEKERFLPRDALPRPFFIDTVENGGYYDMSKLS